MSLNAAKKKHFRSIGHNLNPVVMVADKGLTEGVVEETMRALNDHELIKVKFAIGDRDARQQLISQLLSATNSDLIQTIGKIALIFKPAKKPNPALSNLLRVQ
ncbi:YhbY family RNA-binding protein [Endozoicomonas ascidiicola]|uniref:YhbY family RNA-binding protein n=1 Tax=Endozoicomonas ascidiicola TaxID=1698521 RepID=UPI0008311804|nr:YhbY family RNA-binding protein [Endozoicomonas ascidiicola]